MPVIRVTDDVSAIISQEYLNLMEESKELTKKVVDFLNEQTDDYSASASALAFATLLFIRGIKEIDEKTSEETRKAILEIVSEGR